MGRLELLTDSAWAGGCCGTNARVIRLLRQEIEGLGISNVSKSDGAFGTVVEYLLTTLFPDLPEKGKGIRKMFGTELFLNGELGKLAAEAVAASYLSTGVEGVLTGTWSANLTRFSEIGKGGDEFKNYRRSVYNTAVQAVKRAAERLGIDRRNYIIFADKGPAGDDENPSEAPSIEESALIHGEGIQEMARAGADAILLETIGTVGEAIGGGQAAERYARSLPYIVSFRLDPDGANILDGTPLDKAIEEIDSATRVHSFWINCTHPDIVEKGLAYARERGVLNRIRGIKPNPIPLTAERSAAREIITMVPEVFARRVAELTRDYLVKKA